ncbi:TRAP transporter permease [Chloroflexota bacterium]
MKEAGEEVATGVQAEVRGVFRGVVVGLTLLGFGVILVDTFAWSVAGRFMMPDAYRALFLAIFLPLTFLIFPIKKGARGPGNRVPWYDVILALISAVGPLYYFFNSEAVNFQGLQFTAGLEVVALGTLTWIILLEAARRSAGWMFSAVVLLFSAYPLVAGSAPGILAAKNYSFVRLTNYHFLGGNSILGLPLGVMSDVVAHFLLFAAIVVSFGIAGGLIEIAKSLVGTMRGGAAKISIVSSAFFASLSGSATANVFTTGSVTIPFMKETGYEPHYAAAVEATASTGGTLTPPVMGAVAFMMAEFLRLPYADICIIAIIPAFLYFLSIFIQSDLHAVKVGIKGMPVEKRPLLWPSLKLNGTFIIILLVMVFLLIYMRMAPPKVALYVTGLVILLIVFRKATRPSLKKVFDAVYKLAGLMALLTPMLAAAGMIMGALSLTGVGYTLGVSLVGLAGGNTLFLLLIVFIICFIMGMAGQIAASYIILLLLVIPGMIEAGLWPLGSHFFVVYLTLTTYVTPPIAYSVFAAAALANASFWKTAWQALRLVIVAFIMPFMFIYEPAILLNGTGLEILQALVPILIAIISLSFGVEGYVYKIGSIRWPARVMLVAGGLLLIPPIPQSRLIGGALIVAGLVIALLIKWVSPKRA